MKSFADKIQNECSISNLDSIPHRNQANEKNQKKKRKKNDMWRATTEEPTLNCYLSCLFHDLVIYGGNTNKRKSVVKTIKKSRNEQVAYEDIVVIVE